MHAISLTYSQYISGLVTMARNQEFPHMARAARALLHREGLGECDGDGYADCNATATVHVIETEQDFCSHHYRKVTR